jgi:hypothetical protein
MNYPARKFSLGKLLGRRNSQILGWTKLHFPGDLNMDGTIRCTLSMPGGRDEAVGVFKPLSQTIGGAHVF